MNRVRNFCAGPCTLPTEVLAEVRDELLDFQDSGMSLVEMSHRSPEYDEVHDDALHRFRRALQVPDDFEVLFVQGGGVLQFAMVPMNLVPSGSSAGYVRSGAWGNSTGRVYVMGKTLRWIEDCGGLAGMAERAARRSGQVYDAIDTSGGFYTGPAEPQARSRTNVVFRLADPALDGPSLADARSAGLLNLKGHRSVGGMRASIYNAMPDEGVDELVGFMRDFAASAG